MKLTSIKITNIRNVECIDINLNYPVTIIYGNNAQGKTTILESIYYLSIGKTVRRGLDKSVISKDKKQAYIKGSFLDRDDNKLNIDFFLGSKKVAKVNGLVSKLKNVIGEAKVVLFTAEDISMVESPQRRRRFLDVLISVLNRKYLSSLIEYNHVIKRRNKLLFHIKNDSAKVEDLLFWDTKVAKLGSYIVSQRQEIVDQINIILAKSSFFKNKNLKLRYLPKGREEKELLSLLLDNSAKEVVLNQTTVGPHRDLISFYIGSLNLDSQGSRGEKRGAIVELKKAEIELVKKNTKESPILLLDDVFSELDPFNKKIIKSMIKNEQTIITTTHRKEVKQFLPAAKVYTIKNGEVSEEQWSI